MLLGGGAIIAAIYFANGGPAGNVAVQVPTIEPPSADTTRPTPASSESDPPAQESAPPTPAPSETGTEARSRRAEPGSPISHREFGDWNFGLGSLKFSADKVGGWDYTSCAPVDAAGVLAKTHCDQAVQIAYSAYGGNIKAVQVLLGFPTARDAKAAATRLAKLSSSALKWRRDRVLKSYAYGKIRWRDSKDYVIVTIVTANKAASGRAAKFHGYMQADIESYFTLRDL
ncbi:hypothetical protein [Sphaerisporangium dianthi]|uniref:Uncharacterized protein n=1 Tax=Sphaerisporangium dianthi TaxID=1436120 RepID=A0ABV9C826_9ACTN